MLYNVFSLFLTFSLFLSLVFVFSIFLSLLLSFYVFFSLFLSCGRSGAVVRCFFELVGAPWALWGALGKLFESSQGVFGSSFASLFELSVSRHTLGALIFRI